MLQPERDRRQLLLGKAGQGQAPETYFSQLKEKGKIPEPDPIRGALVVFEGSKRGDEFLPTRRSQHSVL